MNSAIRRTIRMFVTYKMLPGYAETSTRRNPREPETVIVGEDECSRARCLGDAYLPNAYPESGWLCFKIPGERRYFFQYRPW